MPTGGPASEAGQAGRERGAAPVCAGPPVRRGAAAGRDALSRVRRSGGSVGVTAGARTGAGRKAWSPEQISHRLRLDFPDDESMRVSHEAIYQSLYVQGRGALRRELTRVPAHRPGAAGPESPGRGAGRAS